jgi:hypothetical protein
MIATKVKVDASKLTAFIPQYLAETRRGIKAGTISVARTVAQELIKYTPPFDRGDFTSYQQAKKAGEGALERDIRKVYWTPSRLFSEIEATVGKVQSLEELAIYEELTGKRRKKPKQILRGYRIGNEATILYSLIKEGKFSRAEELLKGQSTKYRNVRIGLFDGGKAHKQSRNRRGRVFRHVPALIVADTKQLDAYIKAKKQMVGFTRGGWLSGAAKAEALPRKTPVWIKRWQGKSPGDGSQTPSRRGFAVRIANGVSFMSSSISPSRINSALKDAEAKLRKQMEIIVAHRNRKV